MQTRTMDNGKGMKQERLPALAVLGFPASLYAKWPTGSPTAQWPGGHARLQHAGGLLNHGYGSGWLDLKMKMN